MSTLSNSTLAQIVKSNFRSAAVFEKYDLDFCCKGKRTLEEACAEKQILPDALIKELESAMQEKQATITPAELPPAELVDYIVTNHHAYVSRELPQIMAYLQKVTAKHGPHHSELYRIFEIFQAVKAELEQHLLKEEQVLFPSIKMLAVAEQKHKDVAAGFPFIKDAIGVMEHEHDAAGSGMSEIRNLTNNYTAPQGACTTFQLMYASLKAFELDLHQHVHLENYVLFPEAIRLQEQQSL